MMITIVMSCGCAVLYKENNILKTEIEYCSEHILPLVDKMKAYDMEERKRYFYIKLWKLVIDVGPGEWKLAVGYSGSRRWRDRYLYLTAGIFYIRLWLTGETR